MTSYNILKNYLIMNQEEIKEGALDIMTLEKPKDLQPEIDASDKHDG